MKEPDEQSDRARVRIPFDARGAMIDGFIVGVALPTLVISALLGRPSVSLTGLGVAVVVAVAIGAIARVTTYTITHSGIERWHLRRSKRKIPWEGITKARIRRLILSRWIVLDSCVGEVWMPFSVVQSRRFATAVADLAPIDHVLRTILRGGQERSSPRAPDGAG